MGFFDRIKNKSGTKQEPVSTESKAADSHAVDWRVAVEEKKNSIRMNTVPVQRSIFKVLRKAFPSLDPFFLTMKEDFDDLNDEIHTEQEVNRVLNILAQICLRFNSGLQAMKDEAIEQYLSRLNDDDLIMAYIGLEYYRNYVKANESLHKTLLIAEKVLNCRFLH